MAINHHFNNNVGWVTKIDESREIQLDAVVDTLPENADSKHLESSLDAYVINKLNAINTQSGVEVKNYYEEVYKAMQCSIYFMQKNNIDGYAVIKKINNVLDSDSQLLKQKEHSEKIMQGSVFLAIPKNEQPQVCVENY